MSRGRMIQVLRDYFQRRADFFNIDLAFLYGSYASGHPVDESDIDVAVLSSKELDEDTAVFLGGSPNNWRQYEY